MKYRNKPIYLDGHKFDSKKEGMRYLQLKTMQANGEITNLRLQVPFELIPNQYEPSFVTKSGKTKQGKLIERKCEYKADFVYDVGGVEIVEDTKGMKTKDYIIKRKLMLMVHGIRIKEV